MKELRDLKDLTIHYVQPISVLLKDCSFPTARHSFTTFVVKPKILLGHRRGHPANQKTRLCLVVGFNFIREGCVYLLGEGQVLHSFGDARLHLLEVVRVDLCIPRPLDPRDDSPALGPGVFADQPGSEIRVQGLR